ncbi:MAG TPA: MATE family efflux transporter [Candidatus Atribacteria bacterium]|nr:MATE family efflux transporter [Candidatus Atribacteria bacterium]
MEEKTIEDEEVVLEGEAFSTILPEILDKKHIRSKAFSLSLPALLNMLLISFVGMVDMIMVGRLGPAAISAVGMVNQPIFLIVSVFIALTVGTTALVARFIGAKDINSAKNVAKQSMVVSILFGILLLPILYIFAPQIEKAMGAEPEVLTLGVAYMRTIAIGTPFNVLAMGLGAILRGSGDMKTPLIADIIANLSNILGNYILIFGKFGAPALGVAGAGIATSIARFISSIILLYVLYRGKTVIKLSLKENYGLDFGILKRIFNIGIPSALEQFVLRAGQLTFVRIVAELGTIAFATHQIAMNIQSLSFMPGQAFSMAATTLVGQLLGANKPDIAEESARQTRLLGMIVSGISAFTIFFFGKYITMLYTNDIAIIEQSRICLRIIALIQPAQSTQFILAGALRGAGDTRFPLYSTIIGIWGMRVALAYLFVMTFGWGLTGAWLAIGFDQILRAIVIYSRFRSGKWKHFEV